MEAWRKIRLGDACKTNSDSYSPNEGWAFVNYLDTGNITGNRIDSIQYIDVKTEKLPSRARRKVKKDSIIYSTVRPNQRHFGIIKSKPENFLVSTGFAVIDTNPRVLNADFLYYLLTQSTLVEALHAIAEQSTSAYPSIKPSDIEDLEIDIPDLATQKKIANILRSFDRKIQQNTKINENLADQIQSIYCNEFDPITHTPSGVLADICQYSMDRIPVSKLSVSTYYSTENMQPNKSGSIDATGLPSITQTTICHKGDVLISNIRPYFKKIVYVTGDNCGCSTDVLCFVPKEDFYSAFLFGTLYMDRFFDYMVAGSKGTKMPRGDKQQIMNYPIILPSKESLDLFNGLVVPMLDQIASNRIENSKLAALRDTLLPRLMSGELDVSALNL